jgi:hypothetical protein
MSSVLTYNGHGLKLITGSGYVRVSGEKYVPIPKAEIVFRFSSSSYTPTASLLGYSRSGGGGHSGGGAHWVHVSGADWKVVTDLYTGAGGTQDTSLGIGRLCTTFTDNATFTTANTGGVTAEIISVTGPQIQTMDRAFVGCDAITGFSSAVTSLNSIQDLYNVNQAFDSCTGVEDDSALSLYDAWSQNSDITSHSSTFSNCGPAQYLAQIPVGWGGTQIPASTLMTSARGKWKSNYDVWEITADGPEWYAMDGVYVFTEASVSSYAGVSMNRSRIAKFNSLNTTKGQAALYFYPCFMQHTSSYIAWAVSTATPNGTLTISQGNTDMPGTLDYSTYGPFVHEFGTYNPAGAVYFCFLVTNEPISSSFNLSSSPYGVLFNSNFKTDAGLRWFR